MDNSDVTLPEEICIGLDSKIKIIKEVTEDHKRKIEIFDFLIDKGNLNEKQI
jgi:hypothetical protein